MQFNPKALLISAVFITMLWFAVTQGFGLVAIAFDTLVGWGLWQWFPQVERSHSRRLDHRS
jgi:hypothetical protein